MNSRRATETITNPVCEQTISKTIKTAVDIVGSTYGPNGSNILINRGGRTRVTKDGVSCLMALNLKDPFENAVLDVLKDACLKTSHKAGDGTTGTLILTKTIYENLLATKKNLSPIKIRDGVMAAVKAVIEVLNKPEMTVTVDPNSQQSINSLVRRVAIISTNEDLELVDLITEIFCKIGRNANIKLEQSNTTTTSYSISQGYNVSSPRLSPYFANEDGSDYVLENPAIYVSEKAVNDVSEIVPILNKHGKNGEPVVIFAPRFDSQVINMAVMAKIRGLKTACVEVSVFGNDRDTLKDIAAITGADIISTATGVSFLGEGGGGGNVSVNRASSGPFGTAASVTINGTDTIIIRNEKADSTKLNTVIENLATKIKNDSEKGYDVSFDTLRLGKLTNGIAVLRVGGNTEIQVQERYDLAEDAINACKSALATGVVAGAGAALAFFNGEVNRELVDKILKKHGIEGQHFSSFNQTSNTAFKIGVYALLNSLGSLQDRLLQTTSDSEYIKNLIKTTKEAVSTNNNKNKNQAAFITFNANSMEVGDALELGVVDPLWVVENILINAATAATTLFTTVAITTEQQTKENTIADAITAMV